MQSNNLGCRNLCFTIFHGLIFQFCNFNYSLKSTGCSSTHSLGHQDVNHYIPQRTLKQFHEFDPDCYRIITLDNDNSCFTVLNFLKTNGQCFGIIFLFKIYFVFFVRMYFFVLALQHNP